MALSDLCPTYSYRDEAVFGSDIRGRLFFVDTPASSVGSAWCYYFLVFLFGATDWFYCLVLLFGATVWRWWQIVFW